MNTTATFEAHQGPFYAFEPTHVVLLITPSPSAERVRLTGVDMLHHRVAFAIDAPTSARAAVEQRLREEFPHAIRVTWDVSFLGWDDAPDPDGGSGPDRIPGGDAQLFAENLYQLSRLGKGGQLAVAELVRTRC